MKRLITLLAAASLAACAAERNTYPEGIPESYHAPLDEALSSSPRREALDSLLRALPAERREGAAFLVANMPRGDRDTMSLALLAENIDLAYRARERYAWCAALTDSVFFNEVLPYAVVDEVRDSWREDMFARFAPVADRCADMRSAVEAVNACIASTVDVEYNTLREKTNQSPSESMRQHMASCTGLSILLVDALRSVGIPARFAGTAAWHDDRGNHSWTEVMIDGRWYFTEYAPPRALDRTWFLSDAGRATAGDRDHAVYAVSFMHTGDWFPMVWSEQSRDVHGIDVTQRYVDVCAQVEDSKASDGRHVALRIAMFRDSGHTHNSADRVAANVDIFCGEEQIGGGRTADPQRDMNDFLTLLVEKNRTYTLLYEDASGTACRRPVEVADSPVTVNLYMNR